MSPHFSPYGYMTGLRFLPSSGSSLPLGVSSPLSLVQLICSFLWLLVLLVSGVLPHWPPARTRAHTAGLTSGMNARSQDQRLPQTGSKLWGCMALPRRPEVKRQCRGHPGQRLTATSSTSGQRHGVSRRTGSAPGWTPECPLPTWCWVLRVRMVTWQLLAESSYFLHLH